jgi:DNA-binding NarL/FixJ family response regulator
MPELPKVIAFDVDPDSLANLRQAFPNWDVESVKGATADSLEREWSPAEAALLVVGVRDRTVETLALCRGLRSQAGRARTPLLVLVSSAHGDLIRAALEVGAHSCLVSPVYPQDLVEVVARAQEGNRPGRHTPGLERAQESDRWRDDGGEA